MAQPRVPLEPRESERRALGQYFTPPPLVDLVLALCVRRARDRVLDPSCGAGAFLEGAARRLAGLARDRGVDLGDQVMGFEVSPRVARQAGRRLRAAMAGADRPPQVWPLDFFRVRPGQALAAPCPTGDEVVLPRFDAVVGNPPYLRHERVTRARSLDAASACRADWPASPAVASLSTQSDRLVAFFVHGAAFLKEGGRLGFVASRAWLDTRYGAALRRFLLERFKLVALIESRCEPWFDDALVNTIVVVAERCASAARRAGHRARFIELKRPLAELLAGGAGAAGLARSLVSDQETSSNCESDAWRIRVRRQGEIDEAQLSRQPRDRPSLDARWGSLLRAPDCLFEFARRLPLVPLAAVALVGRGLKTGVNQFFFVDDARRREFAIEPEFLRPVLRSLREAAAILVEPAGLASRLFVCPLSTDELRARGRRGALAYVRWGEAQRSARGIPWPEVPSVGKGRPHWHALTIAPRHQARLFWPLAWHTRLAHLTSESPLLVDQRLATIRPRPGHSTRSLAIALNSALGLLFTEATGRVALGEGALDLPAEDARLKMWIPPPTRLETAAIEEQFLRLARRPLLPIFEEVEQPDRRAFDLAVFQALGLDGKDLEAAYEGLCLMARQRLLLASRRAARHTNGSGDSSSTLRRRAS